MKQTAFQQCRNIESSHGFQLIADDAGNQMLFYQFDQIPPYGARVVSISAELGLSQLPRTVPVKPDKTIYLQPEKYMESDHPLIRESAEQLK